MALAAGTSLETVRKLDWVTVPAQKNDVSRSLPSVQQQQQQQQPGQTFAHLSA